MEGFASLIQSLSGLHDAEITSLVWTPAQAEIRMSINDLSGGWDDRPKHPGVFVFSGVTDVEWAVDRPDARLTIYDWAVVPIVGGYRSEIKVCPSGQLVIQCGAVVLAPAHP